MFCGFGYHYVLWRLWNKVERCPSCSRPVGPFKHSGRIDYCRAYRIFLLLFSEPPSSGRTSDWSRFRFYRCRFCIFHSPFPEAQSEIWYGFHAGNRKRQQRSLCLYADHCCALCHGRFCVPFPDCPVCFFPDLYRAGSGKPVGMDSRKYYETRPFWRKRSGFCLFIRYCPGLLCHPFSAWGKWISQRIPGRNSPWKPEYSQQKRTGQLF